MALLIFVSGLMTSSGAGKAERVVLIVWDGMRPDFVSARDTPTLYKLAQEGVTFAHHHSVYPTSTEVNGTALATGDYPNRSGLMANKEYRPEIDWVKPVDTQDLAAIRKGDELSQGRYLAVPTVAEILQQAGFRTLIAGTKPVALLHDRGEKTGGVAAESVTLFAGKTIPEAALAPIVAAQGAFPVEQDFPDEAKNAWTTRALVEQLWKKDLPRYSLLWLSEPDFSQHLSAPGSAMARAALKSSDDNLATVLAALEARGGRASTDIFVVSDHGFSTISEGIDITALLQAGGFSVAREFKQPPQRGDIMVVGLGGSVSFYITDHDEATIRRLVEFLQQAAFTGVIFTQLKIEGTFTLAQIRINTPAAPDVVMAFRWMEGKNDSGAPGLVMADWNRGAKHGTHATLSPYDLHNTLIANGPDFRRGWIDSRPSGNVDLAPTILSLLGCKPLLPMDGRVLEEAWTTGVTTTYVPQTTTWRADRTFSPQTRWEQYLRWSEWMGYRYFDEGNRAEPASDN